MGKFNAESAYQTLKKKIVIVQAELQKFAIIGQKLEEQQAIMKDLKGNHGDIQPHEIRDQLRLAIESLNHASDVRKNIVKQLKNCICP